MDATARTWLGGNNRMKRWQQGGQVAGVWLKVAASARTATAREEAVVSQRGPARAAVEQAAGSSEGCSSGRVWLGGSCNKVATRDNAATEEAAARSRMRAVAEESDRGLISGDSGRGLATNS
ncbi:hypothetical protein B296_00038846 [Ensete ventricosum]|uniref:DUF834 domain-containing protein n=1 Tax=Ensete ventricosum TaxID=4639 RepID=A0A426X532_ENSVE|nr:hypothetical protein B296_00038846 [Ensete ventricosum]